MTDEADSPKRNEAETKWVSVQEAARLLGISERAVQLRAAAGKIGAQRDGRTWRICLDGEAPAKPSDEAEANPDEASESPEAKRNEADSALLEQLRSENAWLRERVEQHEEEIRRRDTLAMADKQELQRLRQQLAIASTPVESAPSSSLAAVPDASDVPGDQTPVRKWWQFWK